MTMPSKTWMRSLSPSRTFTCTRTVSPDRIGGPLDQLRLFDGLNRLHDCSFQDSQAAQLGLRLATSELRVLPAAPAAAPACAAPLACRAPALDLRVVARHEHVGHRQAAKHRRPRVVRVVEQPVARTSRATTDSASPTTPGTSRATASTSTSAGSSPPRQHVVADRNLVGHERLARPARPRLRTGRRSRPAARAGSTAPPRRA